MTIDVDVYYYQIDILWDLVSCVVIQGQNPEDLYCLRQVYLWRFFVDFNFRRSFGLPSQILCLSYDTTAAWFG